MQHGQKGADVTPEGDPEDLRSDIACRACSIFEYRLSTRRFSIFLFILLLPGSSLLQPMAVGAIGGLALGIVVALFLMPCLYLAFSETVKLEQSRAVQ